MQTKKIIIQVQFISLNSENEQQVIQCLMNVKIITNFFFSELLK